MQSVGDTRVPGILRMLGILKKPGSICFGPSSIVPSRQFSGNVGG